MNYQSIISEFKKQYGYLQIFGLQIHGVGNLISDYNVISISVPFIFDKTKLPEKFMGLDLRSVTAVDDLPIEFRSINSHNEYIWAYQRFEAFVDKHSEEIRKTLQNPKMTRKEMLDALCFGNFENHKQQCILWESEGKIPKWEQNGSR